MKATGGMPVAILMPLEGKDRRKTGGLYTLKNSGGIA